MDELTDRRTAPRLDQTDLGRDRDPEQSAVPATRFPSEKPRGKSLYARPSTRRSTGTVPAHVWIWRRVLRYAPGLLALAAVGYGALLSSHFLAGLSYIPMAVLLGAFISNTFGVHRSLVKGISTYELWLKAGIVLLGSQVALSSLGSFWAKALPLAAATVIAGLVLVLCASRLLRLPVSLSILLAIGTGVCGVSAIIHTARALGADDEEIEYAVGAILAIGAAAVLAYPLLGSLFDLPTSVYGLWTGLSVNNTAEVVATGYSYADSAGQIAIASKLCRVVMLGFATILLVVPLRGARSGGRRYWFHETFRAFPKFVLLFFLVSLLASTGFLSSQDQESLRNISSWLFLLAFAGIGFKLRWENIRHVGSRPIVAVGAASLLLSGLTLGVSIAVAGFVLK